MTAPIQIQMIGSQVACAEGIKDTWREVGDWTNHKLKNRFGPSIVFEYYDLFDPNCPPLPLGAKLPYIIVGGNVVINGGKVSVSVIRRKIEDLISKSEQSR